jgi:large subunit ribosomal protein L30
MAKKTSEKKQPKLLAVIRVRGKVNVSEPVERTLKMLRLHKKHRCVLVPSNSTYLGMINKVKDYCTFGEISKDTLTNLIKKRARTVGDSFLTEDFLKKASKTDINSFVNDIFSLKKSISEFPGVKPFFKLQPPIGGYERKGIKTHFSVGGVLGYRGEEINKLIGRMV